MTKEIAFLLGMLVEGVVAALLAILLRKQFDLSRFGAAVRCGAAAVIGTGATNPATWAWFEIGGMDRDLVGCCCLERGRRGPGRDVVLRGRVARPLAVVPGAFDRGQCGGV